MLELDLALAALVVLRANVAVHDLQRQDHVVEVGNVAELKIFIPNGIQIAVFDGRFLVSKVLVPICLFVWLVECWALGVGRWALGVER